MDGIAWAASAMSAARERLDVAAENVANGSTDGFRKTLLRGALRRSGVTLRAFRDTSQGALRRTGGQFDFAIAGNGEFILRSRDGSLARTRDGHFSRDRFGRLSGEGGGALMGSRGAIVVPDGSTVESDGRVTRNGIELDRIALPPGATLHRGFLESSNADAIAGMIDVMTAQRSFETAEKIVTAIDSTRERSATQVAAVKS